MTNLFQSVPGRFELPEGEVNYQSKKPLALLNNDLKKYLYSLSIVELDQLVNKVRATAKELDKIQGRYEKAVRDYYEFQVEHWEIKAKIDKEIEKEVSDKYSISFFRDLTMGDKDRTRRWSDKEALRQTLYRSVRRQSPWYQMT